MVDSCENCFFLNFERRAELGPMAGVDITIASPGVLTLPNHSLVKNAPVILTTTGALPTGLTGSRMLFALPTGNDTLNLAATMDGAAINTSGAQSGVHTLERVIMGCHREPPQNVDPLLAKWREVRRDEWCGDYLQTYPSATVAFADWTATLGGCTGTIAARFATIGKAVLFDAKLVLSAVTADVTFTLPTVPNKDAVFGGADNNGNAIVGTIAAAVSVATLKFYDATALLARTYVVTGLYETQ